MEYIINAEHQRLGRLASHIAVILQGKLSPGYEPRLSGKDRVVVKNIGKMSVSGEKASQKVYYRHTGYMGHLRERTFEEAFARSPAAVLRRAVAHMLPKNRLQTSRLARLKIEH
jgi:large subunit ribosomal protein L13